MTDSHDRAAERVWGALATGAREALERGLPPPTCKHC
jgi:hypothetical protein